MNKIKDIYWKIVYAFQRAFRGYDNRSYWNLNSEIQDHILFGVRFLREHGMGHPAWLYKDDTDESYEASVEEWHSILDEIIEGLEAGIEADECSWWTLKEPMTEENWQEVHAGDKERYAKRDKALALFVKYFDDMWD